MKKLLGILVLGLLWCNVVHSKEFESIYGFTFNLPDSYSVKRHSPDVDKMILDKETKEIIKVIKDSGTLLGIIEFYRDKRYSGQGITIQFQNYYEDSNPIITEQDVKNLCSEVVEFWKGRGVKKEIYECGLIDTPKGVVASYYMESSGADKRFDKMLGANFLIDGKVFQVMGGCAEKNCKEFKKDFFQVLDTMVFTNIASKGSPLPECKGPNENWTNCFGTIEFENGEKFAGEFLVGCPHGQGTHTAADGTIIQKGKWNMCEFVEPN